MRPLLVVFHGAGPEFVANSRFISDMLNINRLQSELNLSVLVPTSPRNNSPIGSAWPVDDSVDDEILVQISEHRAQFGNDSPIIAIGYSSGAFFATGLALRHPGAFKAVGCIAGGINARDVWRIPLAASRFVFVHGAKDKAVSARGGTFPINRDSSEWEGYLGWEHSAWALNNSPDAQADQRIDFIDPADDGWLMGAVFGRRFAGIDTTKRIYGPNVSAYLVDVWGHVDYIGIQAMTILTRDLLGV